jgi:outer membrane protein OmpA-like peptidoglycan-associated protein
MSKAEMSKQANASTRGNIVPSGIQRLLLAGMAAAGCLCLAPAAQAQQAYYFPQASSAPVSVNYGALTPYAAPAAPGVPSGFQPYGYAPNARLSAAPKSVFTPYGQPAYAPPAYGSPAAVYGQPVYGAPAPTVAPFVAPYANPAFAPGFAANRAGLPASTPTSNGYPQSYLNAPGAQQSADVTPTKKKRKKKKAAAVPAEMPASTPTATEEAAAAQVAAAEAVLESAPAAPATPAPAETQVAAAEPVPAPTPPAEPEAVPASVPSPAASAPAAATAAAPAAAPAGSETPSATTEAPAAEAPAAEQPTEQVASAEAPAETAPDTSGSAVLPAGGTRIVFEPGSDDLPQGATADLDALAEKMIGDQNIKVQVLAYSSGTPDAESQARRKALARGLEVRKYLIGKGVRSNRIDVRALGTKSEGNPADRVDIVPAAG